MVEEPHTKAWRIFEAIRRVTIFLLGTLIIVDGLIGQQDNQVPILIIGMVMVGVLPLDNLVGAMSINRKRSTNGAQSLGSTTGGRGANPPSPGAAEGL